MIASSPHRLQHQTYNRPSKMDATTTEIVHDFYPRFRIYKDGRVERFRKITIVPPSDDPLTGVHSKDIVISPPESNNNHLSARLYLPKSALPYHKLPLVIYFHGGAYCQESAFSAFYHTYVNTLAAKANVVVVSVDYRLAPENPIPACYEDAWSALQWVAQHSQGNGSEPWLNTHVDFDRIHLAGDSAGGNISHNLALRAGTEGMSSGLKIVGVVLVHPHFGNDEMDIHFYFWMCVCPESSGIDDPRLNPATHRDLLAKLCCSKVLVCVAGKDGLRDRGWSYYEALKKSGWNGSAEIVETEGEGHVFHLEDPSSERAADLMNKVASFITRG